MAAFFDSCLRGLLIHTTQRHTRIENKPHLENRLSSHRAVASRKTGISAPRGGGGSDTLGTSLESAGVFVITTIGEDAGKILAALLSNPFDASRFFMPSRGGRCNGRPPRDPRGPFPLQQRNPHSFTAQSSQTIKGVIRKA
jgi:hypothetical protein